MALGPAVAVQRSPAVVVQRSPAVVVQRSPAVVVQRSPAARLPGRALRRKREARREMKEPPQVGKSREMAQRVSVIDQL